MGDKVCLFVCFYGKSRNIVKVFFLLVGFFRGDEENFECDK